MKQDRIVLLHVIDTLGFGGAETFLIDLCVALPSDRYQTIVCAVAGEGPRAADLRRAGIEFLALQARSNWDATALVRLVRLMRRRNVGIVHTHLFVGGVFGRLASILAGVPIRLTTEQNAYAPGYTLPRWQVLTDSVLARLTHQMVAVSQGTQEFLVREESVPAEKIRVVPNAIQWPTPIPLSEVEAVKQELGAAERFPFLGTVARLTPQKGLKYLIQAVSVLRSHFPDLLCVIVGEGELRPDLESLVRQLGVEHHIHFCGLRRDVAAILQGLDLFVLPSLFEGLPLSLLEAMAAGRPVVATRVAGSSEVIEDGVNGRLVPPKDADTLAQAIEALLTDQVLAQDLACRGQETIRDKYTIGPVAREYDRIYGDLLRAQIRPGDAPS